ncbi:MAG: ABC transporter ATP-binding protein [Ignavibacteria bacterium]|jgi:ABC-2 type transport system ATP-binding protein|nr:ABC transporter ATP-binding protein [Ignavibacteria bacterium]
MIKVTNLSKSFGNFKALDNISFQLEAGDFAAFLGPNGAGKTTAIKIIAGLLSPLSGNVSIKGFDIKSNPLETKRLIGYIPDQPFLYDKLSGLEFLKFTGGLFGLSKHDIKIRIEETIDLLQLGEWISRRTETYSQGMKQRVSIASSLLSDPDFILVDEPMVGLDPQSANIVKTAFRKKVNEGKTILMSTHSLHIAEEICSHIIILNEGKIIFDDLIDSFKSFQEKEFHNLESFFLEITR